MNPSLPPQPSPEDRLLEIIWGYGAASDPHFNTEEVRAWLHSTLTNLPNPQGEHGVEIIRRHLGLDGQPPERIDAIAADMGVSKLVARNREARAIRRVRKLWSERRRAAQR